MSSKQVPLIYGPGTVVKIKPGTSWWRAYRAHAELFVEKGDNRHGYSIVGVGAWIAHDDLEFIRLCCTRKDLAAFGAAVKKDYEDENYAGYEDDAD